jgi:hypothetical protein
MRIQRLESWWTTIHKDFIGRKEIRLKFSSLVKCTIFISLHPLFSFSLNV